MCIEMHFLPDVWVECDACRGRRYNPETLAVPFHGQSIADVLEMSCGKAVKLFENIPKIRRILQTLCDVGLDYLRLGQPAPTLSGGEAQRVKLAAELARPDTGRTLYLLDEPTTGLHFDDFAKLLEVLNRLVDLGNTVVVIEHNLDVIKTADWIIDMGPEAGDGGGCVVAEGTPEEVVAAAKGGRRKAEGGKQKVKMHRFNPCPQAGRSAAKRHFPHRRRAGPHPRRRPVRRAQAARFRRRRGKAGRRFGNHRSRQASQNAVGSRRPPLAHGRSCGPQRRTVPLGWPHSGPSRRSHSRTRRIQRHRIGTTAAWWKLRPRKKPTAGSCTPSPASSGC